MKKLTSLVFVLALGACGPGDSPNNDGTDSDDSDIDGGVGEPCQEAFPTQCSGDQYQECQDGFFVTVDTCTQDETCVNGTGCVQCDPFSDTVCQGNDVFVCTDEGTIGEMVEACGAETCESGHCGGSTTPACDAGDYIYLVDNANNFIRFDPRNDAHTFDVVGQLACPAGLLATPFSMSVDRNGVAWVLYSNGKIFHVDTETLACQDSGFATNQDGFWSTFGMGFVTDTASGTSEKLWIGGGPAAPLVGDLGYIDASLDVQRIGDLPPGDTSPEFTGTGAAELYAYYPGQNNSFVARLDKTNAAIQQEWELPPNDGDAVGWAFAHWGGRFYIFITTSVFLSETRLTLRLDPATGDVDTVVQNMPYMIVGAGVSTCAPIVVE